MQLEIKSLTTSNLYQIYTSRIGENQMPCPECSKNRKPQNAGKKSFSFNTETNVGYCQNCSTSFVKSNNSISVERKYEKPEKKNFTKLKDEHLQWFSERGINQETVNAFKLVSENNLIVFPYFRNSELINVKKRSTDKTIFLQGKDCEQIMFNYDQCIDSDEVVVVEGEVDCMSYYQAGIKNVTSVSQGAPNASDKSTDKKLECITNCYELFENKEKIFIHTDNDVNGTVLRRELIRRFGAERCYIVNEIDGCKDANDILCLHGVEALRNGILNAKEVKIDGVTVIGDVKRDILHDYNNGVNCGTTTYFREFDQCYTLRSGEVNVWSGYNNEGKSTFLRHLQLIKSVFEKTKWGLFAPEDYPSKDFYADLVHSYVGKGIDKKYSNVMSEEELNSAMDIISDWFYLVDPPQDQTIDGILDLFKYLVRRKGVNGFTIDPYNQVEHMMKHGEREDLYISRFMSKLKKFAVTEDVIMNLVAHQLTPEFGRGDTTYPKPNLYKIKGGGTFSDKADNVLTVWRPYRFQDRNDPTVEVESQKIKKQRLVGKPGNTIFEYNWLKNRYYLNGYNPLDLIKPIEPTNQYNPNKLIESNKEESPW